jgi:thioredoxin-related protein
LRRKAEKPAKSRALDLDIRYTADNRLFKNTLFIATVFCTTNGSVEVTMDFTRTLFKTPAAVILTALILYTGPLQAEPPQGYDFLRYDEGLRQAEAEAKRVFVYFGRYGCGFCDKTNKVGFADAAVKAAYSKHYVLVYVNSESMDRLTLPSGERITEMQLGERLNTLGTPVFFFLEPDGKQILKVYGYQDEQRLLDMDRYIQGKHYTEVNFNDFK